MGGSAQGGVSGNRVWLEEGVWECEMSKRLHVGDNTQYANTIRLDPPWLVTPRARQLP